MNVLSDNNFQFLLAFSLGFLTSSLFMLAAVKISRSVSKREDENTKDGKKGNEENYHEVLCKDDISEIVAGLKNKLSEKREQRKTGK